MIAWFPTGSASADVGPKPSLEFSFSNNTSQPLSIISGNILGCNDDACLETISYQGYPNAWLDCKQDTCDGGMLFANRLMRLQILFSDNQTRLSNPFKATAMRNVYKVEVYDSNLVVTRNIYLSNNALVGVYLFMIPFTAIGVLLLFAGLFASNSALERSNRTTQLPFRSAPARYVITWVIAAILFVAGSFLTWALPLTILIELGIAYLYQHYYWPSTGTAIERHGDTITSAKHDSHNRPPLLPLVTSVVVVNLITQPLLWGMATLLNGTLATAFSWPILVMEFIVWLAEAILLRILQRHHLKWTDAFQLSFFINIASFLIGLLIPL
jgi:hypothetical protein